SLLCRPVKYTWHIRSEGMKYTIPPDGGKIKILALTRQSKGEMRIPDVVQVPVTLDCRFNLQTLYLKNDPEDGDYSFFLEVIATDEDGVKVDDFEFINVIGRYKTGTLEYTNDVMRCRMERVNAERGRLLEISELGYIEKTLGKGALQGKGSTLVSDRLTHVLNHERAGSLQQALNRSLLNTGEVSSSHVIGQARMIVDIASKLLMERKLDQDLPSNNVNRP
nr:hypothetical protein [Candidatus Sigynarchaeota archaeon]